MWTNSLRKLKQFNQSRKSSIVVCLLLFLLFKETNEFDGGRIPYDAYRVVNDPNQVKPNLITTSNLFAWLNLKNSVRFRLWTRQNPTLAHEIKYNEVESLRRSNFDAKRLTKIIIHGFKDTATEVAVTYYLFDMRDAYLHLGDVNVLLVDYSLFTMPIFYYTSLPDLAGIRLGEFIKFLLANSKLELDSLHLIGFSLGAHVAGLAGHALDGQTGRITGLDPAGPGYHYLPNQQRLDKSDAKFVDIIHTNAGKRFLRDGHLGIAESLGHVDFYPNGGSRQAGCGKPSLLRLSYKDLECSHGRAARYFIESITSPKAFPACNCESLVRYVQGTCQCHTKDRAYMGEHLNHSVRGVYRLITNSRKPFGIGPTQDSVLRNITNYSRQYKTTPP